MAKENRKKQESKVKILDAAKEVFAEQGFDGARVDEIARRAEVNKALLYYYFNSKEQILEELIRINIDEVLKLKEKVASELNLMSKDGKEKFTNILMDFLNNKKDILKIIIVEAFKDNINNTSVFEFIEPILDDIKTRLDDMGLKVKEPLDVMICSFFFGMIPVSMFATLGEKWADYHGFNKDEVSQRFSDLYGKIFIESILNYYLRHSE